MVYSEEELKEALKLFLEMHNYRKDFLYTVSNNSHYWTKSDWLRATNGYSNKNGKYFPLTLPKETIIKAILGQKIDIYNGNKRIYDVEYLGCGFGKDTRYCAIDIDNKASKEKNPYYNIESIHKIQEITKHFGTSVFMQSSYSLGWYLRWYFSEALKTYDLACYLQDLFTKHGFTIRDGWLEIFPNKKSSPGVLYKGLRLPCQKGSALLSLEDGRPVASWNEDPEIFLIHWAEEVRKNLVDAKLITPLIQREFKSEKLKIWYEEFKKLEEEGFTASGQTNKNLKNMAKGYRLFYGISDVELFIEMLYKWLDEKHHGFSEEYNESPQKAYAHCRRLAIWAIKKLYPAKNFCQSNHKKQNNANKAKSAQYEHQLIQAFKNGDINSNMSIREMEKITGVSKSVIYRKKDIIFNHKIVPSIYTVVPILCPLNPLMGHLNSFPRLDLSMILC